jgi:hypothetical protein
MLPAFIGVHTENAIPCPLQSKENWQWKDVPNGGVIKLDVSKKSEL